MTSDAAEAGNLAIRKFPFPYRAILAICSDLDETPDPFVYLESSRYLNTREPTVMGEGLGLEVGNTIYFDMPPGQFSYRGTDDRGREAVHALIRSGHVDCLHSFGDLATTRRHAASALEDLDRHGCRLRVWIDHATAPSNFGSDIMCGSGDLPGSPAYHADLSVAHGIRYVWRGRVTSVVGQDAPRTLSGIADWRHPSTSIRTVGKEFAKGWLGRSGEGKYGMHGANRVLHETTLRSGHRVLEFLRANPDSGGVSHNDTAMGIDRVLIPGFLDLLEERRGACVLYTHLGKVRDPRIPFDPSTRRALTALARRVEGGRIAVTTTRRLLEYSHAREMVDVTATREGEWTKIDVRTTGSAGSSWDDPPATDGLTFYANDPDRVRLSLNGSIVDRYAVNGPDETGRRSVSLPWTSLLYPSIDSSLFRGSFQKGGN